VLEVISHFDGGVNQSNDQKNELFASFILSQKLETSAVNWWFEAVHVRFQTNLKSADHLMDFASNATKGGATGNKNPPRWSSFLSQSTGWVEPILTSLLVWDDLRSPAQNLSFFAGYLAHWPCNIAMVFRWPI